MKTAVLVVLLGLLVIVFAGSMPPSPHNVKGFVFHVNGSGAENDIPVLINDTTQNTSTKTRVSAPPIEALRGAYSGTISGVDGDTIIVFAWNATHYGNSSGTLASTTEINVTMNTTRAPKGNLTIIAPPDNSTFNISVVFNVTANITILGSNGTCNATISFGNTTVLGLFGGDTATHDLGQVNRSDVINTTWNVTGTEVGISNVTVIVACSPGGPTLEAISYDTLLNITIVDQVPPVVDLLSPPNATVNKTSNNITFVFNVTEDTALTNCSLYITEAFNQTNTTSIAIGTAYNFSSLLSNANYTWRVECFDIYGNRGISETWNLTVEVNPPNVTVVSMIQNIVLNAGSTVLVECNLSVTDEDGAANVVDANATFFYYLNTSDDPDDPNVHYTNDSCAIAGSSGNQRNFTCTFPVWFFALNETWNCNATAIDNEGLTDINTTNTTIELLLALNLSETLMHFGDVEAGFTSANITQNVSNLGNQPINVTVSGYGLNLGDGNAFGCATTNISINSTRFAPNNTATYPQKEELDTTLKQVRLTIEKQTEIAVTSQNVTYWQTFVPKNISDIGECNGTIVFQAELS